MADIFDVIADGTRRDILRLLLDRSSVGERGTSVSHIVHELGASQPTVSKHLKVLRDAHLVSVREEGQHRYYSLSSAPLDEVDDWLVPFLGDDEDVLVVTHHLLEGLHRLLAADKERHDHVRENDDVAQRQHGIGVACAVYDRWPGF